MEEAFGDLLRKLRLDTGVGLRELARRIHVSPGYLSDMENGRTPPPSEAVIIRMSQALNVDRQRLLRAARKVDPELSDYVAQQPEVADFLRIAKKKGYQEDDWIRLSQLADIAKLGSGEDDP